MSLPQGGQPPLIPFALVRHAGVTVLGASQGREGLRCRAGPLSGGAPSLWGVGELCGCSEVLGGPGLQSIPGCVRGQGHASQGQSAR